MSKRPYRPLAVFLLVLHLGACTTWQPSTSGLRQLIEEKNPSIVRVTGTDGQRSTLRDPEIRADSIAGIASTRFGRIETSVPVSDIRQIEVRGFNAAGTFTLVTVLGFVIGFSLWASSGWDGGIQFP